MKKLPSVQLCALAVLAVVNIIGANLALMLRLPLYLDSIGTMAAGALFGPLWGAVTGAASALLNGVTTDPYALYYLPVQLITGALAGVVFQKIRIVQDRQLRLPRLFPAAILVSLPGTVVSASVTAFLFGGITSSGSTILVQASPWTWMESDGKRVRRSDTDRLPGPLRLPSAGGSSGAGTSSTVQNDKEKRRKTSWSVITV